MISLYNVSRIYPGPPAVRALADVSLAVDRGDYIAIVGPSGSGKSTLLNLLGLMDRPTTGLYELNGVDTSQLADAERTAIRGQHIGFVFQAFHLLPYRSALENVMLAQLYQGVSHSARRQAAHEALNRVGLAHRLHAMPTMLSGGEKQRVAIARALANSPDMLLCDEPTGNLDSVTAHTILGLLEELHRDGQSVITITHDPAVAARADRVIVIRDGRIATGNTP